MNDQFKKYIEDNREEFDHLEPSPDIFLKLKSQLKDQPKEKKGLMSIVVNQKWLVAASIIMIMSITYLLLNNNAPVQNIDKPQLTNKKTATPLQKDIVVPAIAEVTKNEVKVAYQTSNKTTVEPSKYIDLSTVYTDLADSTSASTRLAAILKIQKSMVISYDIIDNLAKTLNHDSNSNVRLAALNLMSQYTQDSYVANAFLQSLESQKDPLVQLGLINLLSQVNNPKLDDKLYALANDPTTFSAVKDQAYLILLNQNKL